MQIKNAKLAVGATQKGEILNTVELASGNRSEIGERLVDFCGNYKMLMITGSSADTDVSDKRTDEDDTYNLVPLKNALNSKYSFKTCTL